MAEHYPQSLVDEVLARTDLLATVGEYVQLQRRGGRFFGLCPFHREKTGSFSVSPDQGLFYCFGCGQGGSALTFLMRIEGWSFPEALKELAGRAGVGLPEAGPHGDGARERSQRETYYRVLELATGYYESQLAAESSAAARDYVRERGVDPETGRAFRLGYAPPGWESLLSALRRNKVPETAVAEAGLALPGKRGGYYDRFRERIMFPVVDRMGRVIGFSGRTLSAEDDRKYINSPELPYFKKGEQLFGLGAAKESLRTSRRAILVEGNFDVVTLHAAGFRATLAPLGTALTTQQVTLLRRFADVVVLAFDGDEAGQRAMIKAVGPCYEAGLDVRGATLPDGSDPDSFVRERGREAFQDLIEAARPLAELALSRHITPAVGAPPEVRVRAARRVGQVLLALPQGGVRDAYARDAARRLDVPLSELRGSVRGARRHAEASDEASDEAAAAAPLRLNERERTLVQILADDPLLAERSRQDDDLMEAIRPELRAFVEGLARLLLDAPGVRFERLIDGLPEHLRPSVLNAVSAERTYGSDREASYDNIVWQFKRENLRRQCEVLRERAMKADGQGDFELALKFLERADQLTVRVAELDANPVRL